MTPPLRRALAVVGAVAAYAVLTPCSALAGSYVVPACSPASSPGLWVQVNTAPAGFASGNLCGGPEIGPLDVTERGSLWAEDILSSPAHIPDGARAGWTLAAPAGATITAISYYRTITSHGSRDVAAGLYTATGEVLEQCRIAMPFGSPIVCSMANDQAPRRVGGFSTSSLFFGVLCDLVQQNVTACIAGGAPLHDVRAYMYSARVTITESTAPTVTGVGGALWGGGVVSGAVPVTFSASDASGIRGQAVQTSGAQAIASSSQGCDFSVQPPCPQSPNATLDVDTARVPDGTQTFRLVVTDAAGNSQVSASPPVTVDNHGPPPPIGLTATVQPGSSVIELRWSNPPDPPQPVNSAMAQLCSTSCSPAVGVDASGSARLSAPGPGAYSANVWLLDTAGRGGPHNAARATVIVPPAPTPPPPPATRTRISALLHGRRLRVSGPISVSGPVTVSWRSKIRGRTVGRGSRTVTVRNRRVRVTFAVPRRARRHAATIRVVVRSRQRVVGHARARRS